MSLSDFDYFLPQELIAQNPSRHRESSRLLVLDRALKSAEHRKFYDIINFLRKDDVLVLNDTKVVKARLLGRRATGGKVEVFVLAQKEGNLASVLIKPLSRLKIGEEVFFEKGFSCKLVDPKNKTVEFIGGRVSDIMDKIGLLPLPPYINRRPVDEDTERYQTVYAKKEGAVAAPTAGLHFAEDLIKKIRQIGVKVVFLTLHVGYGTFSPVRSEDLKNHKMHEEYYSIPEETARIVRSAKKESARVIAVGTTVCRALEDSSKILLSESELNGDISSYSSLFIRAPFKFNVVDSLVTNFHLPRTTLLMLVCAFAGRDFILSAYNEARERGYRFYSYGDAMLIT